jgi:hypothetical protein
MWTMAKRQALASAARRIMVLPLIIDGVDLTQEI